MITKRKLVLVLRNPQILEQVKFEAVTHITDISDVEQVWKCNKTPLMLDEHLEAIHDRGYDYEFVIDPYLDAENFIAFCHNIGVECGEFMTKEKYDTSKEDCFLCRIGKHDGSMSEFNKTTPRDSDLIIYESEHFFVKIELGCLIKGFVMICPKEHILSAAQIPSDQMKEYEDVKRDIEFLLKVSFGFAPVVFFEHGSAPHGMSSHQRSIVHAHTHVCWGIQFPQKYLDMVCLQPAKLQDLSQVKYLSYQEGADGELLAVSNPEVYVQRQYPRQVIGELIGIDNHLTNWRVEPFNENMMETYNGIYQFLVQNRQFVAPRIRRATDGFVKAYPLRIFGLTT